MMSAPREGHAATDAVDDRAACEVDEALFREPAAAPDPVTDHWINEHGGKRREEEEGQEPAALGNRTGNDGARRCRENQLEEQENVRRQVRFRSPVVREEACEPHEGVSFAKHHAIAHQVEDER